MTALTCESSVFDLVAESADQPRRGTGGSGWPKQIGSWAESVGAALEWIFGLICLLAILAATATLPLVQFISLGYLLEATGRVARSGKLRDGLFLVPHAARAGSLVAGTWLMLLPLRLMSDYWYSSWLIDAGSPQTTAWRLALIMATALMLAHLAVGWICGGRLRHFFWPLLAVIALPWWMLRFVLAHGTGGPRWRACVAPRPLADWFPPAMAWADLRRPGCYHRWRDGMWEFLSELQLPHLFWLGLRGAVGTLIWLLLPISLLIAATRLPEGPAVLAGLAGGVSLALAMFYLPFLQARFAVQGRWLALFDVRQVRTGFRRAPLAFAAALVVTLLFALPLYLLKIELTPREVAFLPSATFVVLILPARLLTGWAIARAAKNTQPQGFVWTWIGRLVALPVVVMYVWGVFLTGYTSWYGVWSLFEQHALLIPVPFIGW